MSDPIKLLGLSCPFGGDFHVCPNTSHSFSFLGCCMEDACADKNYGVCMDYRYTSFDAGRYDLIPPQSCVSTETQWYTCQHTDPPFMGCCAVNPCNSTLGCLNAELYPADLSNDPDEAAIFLGSFSLTTTYVLPSPSLETGTEGQTSISTITPSPLLPTQSRASTSTSTSSPSESSTADHTSGGLSPPGTPSLSSGALAGIVLGVTVFTIVFASLMYKCGKLRQKGKEESRQVIPLPEATPSEPWNPYKDSFSNTTAVDSNPHSPREITSPSSSHQFETPASAHPSWVSGDSYRVSELSGDSHGMAANANSRQIHLPTVEEGTYELPGSQTEMHRGIHQYGTH